MTGADLQRLEACAAALGTIVGLVAILRLPAFLAIGLGAAVFAALVGEPATHALAAFRDGAGDVEGAIGFVLALGAVLGAIITATGAAERLARALLARASAHTLPFLVAAVSMLVGLPLFFEVGLVVLMPVLLALAASSGRPLLAIALPALAGLTALHALVPPHPGPLLAATTLHAPIAPTLGLGVAIAVPAVLAGGLLYGGALARRLGDVAHPPLATTEHVVPSGRSPPPALALAVLLLPVLLMLGRALATVAGLPDGPVARALAALGDPTAALTVAVLASLLLLGPRSGLGRDALARSARAALAPIAPLLLAIGAGGGLKGVLVAAGVTGTVGRLAHELAWSPPLLAWGIAAVFRQATGSATVATAATAALVAPLLAPMVATQGDGSLAAPLLVIAIGAGSVFFCQVNDAGFWMVREFFGLPLGATVLVWSVLQTIVSLTGLVAVLALWPVLVG